jgi:hypothetical protein
MHIEQLNEATVHFACMIRFPNVWKGGYNIAANPTYSKQTYKLGF